MSELTLLSYLITAFFVAINTVYLVHLCVAVPAVRRRVRSLALEDFRDLRESGLAPPISIIVPASPGSGPEIVPVPSRSPGSRLHPPTVWCAIKCGKVQLWCRKLVRDKRSASPAAGCNQASSWMSSAPWLRTPVSSR